MILQNLGMATISLAFFGYYLVIIEFVFSLKVRAFKYIFGLALFLNFIFFTINGDLFLFYDRHIYQLRMLNFDLMAFNPSYFFSLIYKFFWSIDAFWGVGMLTTCVVGIKIVLINRYSRGVGPLFLYFCLSYWYDDYQQIKFGLASLFIFYALFSERMVFVVLAILSHFMSLIVLVPKIFKSFVGIFSSSRIYYIFLFFPLLSHVSLLFGPQLDMFSFFGKFLPQTSTYYAYYADALHGSQQDFHLFRLTNAMIASVLFCFIFSKKARLLFKDRPELFAGIILAEFFYQIFIFSPTVSGRLYHGFEIFTVVLCAYLSRERYMNSSLIKILTFAIYTFGILKFFSNVYNGYFDHIYQFHG